MSIDLRKFLLALIYAAIIIFILVNMTGCYTEQQANKQQDHILRKYPNVAMVAVRKIAPCLTLKSDTIINTIDTTVLVDCPDWKDTTASQYFTVHDTAFFNNIIIRKIKVPVTLPVKTVTITKKIEDVSRAVSIEIQRRAAAQDADKWRDMSDKWRKCFFILLAITGILSIPYIVKAVKFFTMPKIPIKL